MIVTASNIPVPEPIAPMKSANTVKAPIHIPPNAAAVGMYRFSSFCKFDSRWPGITICCSCKLKSDCYHSRNFRKQQNRSSSLADFTTKTNYVLKKCIAFR
ncbi:SecY protein transport family protein [Trifolium repens]|nr:SecY protein transport family protein [Trifolium repens]